MCSLIKGLFFKMRSFYNFLNHLLNKHTYRIVIYYLVKYLPLIFYLIYPVFLLYILVYNSSLFISSLLKPALGFLFIHMLRKVINRQRPFEVFSLTPIIDHENGQSFPSQHTFSSFIISLIIYSQFHIIGIILLCLSLIIALSRLLGGLHFISDILFSIIFTILLYYI